MRTASPTAIAATHLRLLLLTLTAALGTGLVLTVFVAILATAYGAH